VLVADIPRIDAVPRFQPLARLVRNSPAMLRSSSSVGASFSSRRHGGSAKPMKLSGADAAAWMSIQPKLPGSSSGRRVALMAPFGAVST
jgi:hypothetical protein